LQHNVYAFTAEGANNKVRLLLLYSTVLSVTHSPTGVLAIYYVFAPASGVWEHPLGSPLVHACPRADLTCCFPALCHVYLLAYWPSTTMFDSIIDEYFNTTQSSNWSIPSVLKYVESKRYLYVDDISILKSEVYAVLRRHQNRTNMQQRAVSKLEKLLNNYDRLFSAKEIEQFINDLKKKEEEKDLYTSIRRNVTVAYNVEAKKDHHQNKATLRKLHDEEDQVSKPSSSNDQESDTERQDEITSDVVSDASDLCDDQMRELDDIEELEAFGNKRKDSSEEKWTLSTRKDVYMVLNEFRSKIRPTKAHLYPAYFGILDLSGEEPEVKELFTIEEWTEMQADFSKTVVLKEMDSKEEELLYNLFDKIEEVLKRKSDDIVTDIEECIIKGYPKINVIRRLIQT
ncbi:13420_t:CDS:2, partial [Ambispora leptoticha]